MKTIFVISFALLSISLMSQNIEVKTLKSDIFEDDFKNSILILGEKTLNDGLIVVRSYQASGISASSGFYIEKYNANLKLVKEFELKMKHSLTEKSNLVLGVFYANQNVNIIEIYFDLKEKTYICRVNIVDDNFNLSKKELFRISKEKMKEFGSFNLQEKFFEANNKNLPNIYSGDFNTTTDRVLSFSFFREVSQPRSNNSDISIVLNKEKSAYSIILDYKNAEKEGFILYLFNAQSDQIFYKEELIQSKEKNYVLQNFQVSSDGKCVFILAKNYNNKEKKLNYSFDLSQISATETKTKSVEVKDKFIKSLKLNFYNNSIYCLGFYSDTSYKDNDGICFFKFNKENLATEQVKYSQFTSQFIQDKFGKQTDKDVKDLKIKNVLFENDFILLNAEEEFEVNNSSNAISNNSINSKTTFHFDDIVSAKLNTDGTLIWSRNLNKKQSYTYSSDSYISYFSTFKNEVSYFFINASEKVKELQNNRIEFKDVNPNKANLYLLTLNKIGTFSYQLLLNDEETEVPFLVSKGIIIDNSCYFIGRKGKKKQLLKITL